MILYFSATGNCKYVAARLAQTGVTAKVTPVSYRIVLQTQ